MRRRQVAITLSSAIVLGISGALYFGCHSEPSSHGYSLGHLLATYVRVYQGHLTTPGWQDTRQYVREIGTNGLPQMLRWLGEERPQWKANAFDFHEKQPSVLKTKLVSNLTLSSPFSSIGSTYHNFGSPPLFLWLNMVNARVRPFQLCKNSSAARMTNLSGPHSK
jgi:hypothetical protein